MYFYSIMSQEYLGVPVFISKLLDILEVRHPSRRLPTMLTSSAGHPTTKASSFTINMPFKTTFYPNISNIATSIPSSDR